MAKLKTVWTNRAKAQLKHIHDYLKYEKKTPKGAANVKNDLIRASKEVAFAEQYQKGRHQSRLQKNRGQTL